MDVNLEAVTNRIFEAAAVGLACLTTEGRFLNVNEAFCRMTGYSKAELVQKTFCDITHPEDLKSHLQNLELILSGKNTELVHEKRYIRKNGTALWVEVTLKVLKSDNGCNLVATVMDRSHRNQREDALKEEDSRFRLAELATNDAIWEWNLTLQKMLWDRGLENLLGYSKQTRQTNQEWCIEKIHTEDREAVLQSLRQALNNKEQFWSMEFRFLRADQNFATLNNRAFIEYDSNQNPLRIVGVSSDFTELRRSQAELERARDEALRASEAKTAFVANMTHEIRTPLGAILGFTDFLLDPDLSEEEKLNCIQTIKRNGEHLSQLINEVLDLSKLEADRIEVEKIRFDFQDVLKYVSSVLKYKADSKGLSLQIKTDLQLPTRIETDPTRLQQILLNIIGNAIKFTERGEVSVYFETVPKNQSGDALQLRCTVRDTGIGLTRQQGERLFQPFMQADNSMTRKYGGTGLGLYLSRNLARALGGDIVLAHSEPHQGSTFVITLDAGCVVSEIPETARKAVTDRKNPKKLTEDLDNLKVLLVEDMPDNRALIRRLLEKMGIQVSIAENGLEGSEKAMQENYDMVLMDVQMPVMDGYQAVRKLRSEGYRKPVVALTAHALPEDRLQSFEAGFDDHLTKPIDRNSLEGLLAHYGTRTDEAGMKQSIRHSESQTFH